MTPLEFEPQTRPFPRWMGPYSPARGTSCGFRFHGDRLGTWVDSEAGRFFWGLASSPGSRVITDLVLGEWGGGRVLFLPNGFVVKPLQGDDEVGRRALIGRFRGSIELQRAGDTNFDLAHPPGTVPGRAWNGPSTTGLECILDREGMLACTWYHPTEWGRNEVRELLRLPDPVLAAGFRMARRGQSGGRVRVTAHGHVITNRETRPGTWVCMYAGRIEPSSLAGWDRWIGKEPA